MNRSEFLLSSNLEVASRKLPIASVHTSSINKTRSNLAKKTGLYVLLIFVFIAITPFALIRLTYQYGRIKISQGVNYLRNKKDILLVLKTTYDHNGAFNLQPREITDLKDLYPHYEKSISKFEDIGTRFQELEANEKVKILWIRAHGCPDQLLVGQPNHLGNKRITDNQIVHFGNVEKLKPVFNKLADDAVIILEACSTGLKVNGKECIAEKIAEAAPGRTVYSSKKPLNHQRQVRTSFFPYKIIYQKKLDTKNYFDDVYDSYNEVFLRTLGFSLFSKRDRTGIYKFQATAFR